MKSSDAHEKNCNISRQPKILSSRTFLLLKLTLTSTQESVQGFSYRQIPGLTSLVWLFDYLKVDTCYILAVCYLSVIINKTTLFNTYKIGGILCMLSLGMQLPYFH